MDLITPNIGLAFWTLLVFILLLFILTKFVWKPVLGAVNAREKSISESLELAVKTKAEMAALHAQNENLLKEARAQRDEIVRDAKETANKMVEDAKSISKVEAEKIILAARVAIEAEKSSAISEIRSQVADLSVQIAEKIIRKELSSEDKQKSLASDLAQEINLN
jgi:F-type H+-transporting ATPase subunit b